VKLFRKVFGAKLVVNWIKDPSAYDRDSTLPVPAEATVSDGRKTSTPMDSGAEISNGAPREALREKAALESKNGTSGKSPRRRR
jgi:hypothetical protein